MALTIRELTRIPHLRTRVYAGRRGEGREVRWAGVCELPDPTEWRKACTSMLQAGFTEVASFNPYWRQRGRTFEDHDRYRVVLEQAPADAG